MLQKLLFVATLCWSEFGEFGETPYEASQSETAIPTNSVLIGRLAIAALPSTQTEWTGHCYSQARIVVVWVVVSRETEVSEQQSKA